jgi:hypothetical protein
MSLSFLGWLFAFGVVVHNIEEAIYLPGWSARVERRHMLDRRYFSVRARAFRFGAGVLSVAALGAALLASIGGSQSFGACFISGYALAMLLNVFVPHVAATIALRVTLHWHWHCLAVQSSAGWLACETKRCIEDARAASSYRLLDSLQATG